MSRRARSRHSSRVGAADGDAVPAVRPGRVDRQPGRHLVADPQRALGEPLQLGWRVHAVLGVVELLRPDHAEPVFEVAERVVRAEDVDPRRQLHRPRQPLVEVQPRLVPLGDLQRLHPADGEHGDVPLLAGQPVDELDRRAVRRAVALDLLGDREQVATFPRAVRQRRELRRRHAERDRAVEQPFQLGRGRRARRACRTRRAPRRTARRCGPSACVRLRARPGRTDARCARTSCDPSDRRANVTPR